jgi:hypothetical protein
MGHVDPTQYDRHDLTFLKIFSPFFKKKKKKKRKDFVLKDFFIFSFPGCRGIMAFVLRYLLLFFKSICFLSIVISKFFIF